MAEVLGIGGIFFLCSDPETTKAWYEKTLGFVPNAYGGFDFPAKKINTAFGSGEGQVIFAPFKRDSDYFLPSHQPFMVNLVVDDLEGLVARITDAGVELEGEILRESYGLFAWLMDPNGIKLELYQPLSAD